MESVRVDRCRVGAGGLSQGRASRLGVAWTYRWVRKPGCTKPNTMRSFPLTPACLREVLAHQWQQVGCKGARQAHHALPQQRLALVHAHAQRLWRGGRRGGWGPACVMLRCAREDEPRPQSNRGRNPWVSCAQTFIQLGSPNPKRPGLTWFTGRPSYCRLRPCSYRACPVSWMAPAAQHARKICCGLDACNFQLSTGMLATSRRLACTLQATPTCHHGHSGSTTRNQACRSEAQTTDQ